jgi:hypothetical protein
MLGCDWYGFDKKRTRTRYAELVFFHLMGATGHIVHSGASGVRKIDVLFSCSGSPSAHSTKGVLEHVTSNLCFYIQWDMRVT